MPASFQNRASSLPHPETLPESMGVCREGCYSDIVALGEPNDLLTPHHEYLHLGKTDSERLLVYRKLFESHLSEASLAAIRDASNKGWPLGSDHFKQMIQSNLGLRAEPTTRGGDRRSKEFQINRF